MQFSKTSLPVDRRTAILGGIAGAVSVATLFSGEAGALAEEGAVTQLAPGVTFKTLREVKSTIPGFATAYLHELTMEPGSTVGPEALKTVNLCEIQGAPLDVVIEGQAPFTLQPGDIYVCPVGWVETDTNSSDKTCVMRIFELIPA